MTHKQQYYSTKRVCYVCRVYKYSIQTLTHALSLSLAILWIDFVNFAHKQHPCVPVLYIYDIRVCNLDWVRVGRLNSSHAHTCAEHYVHTSILLVWEIAKSLRTFVQNLLQIDKKLHENKLNQPALYSIKKKNCRKQHQQYLWNQNVFNRPFSPLHAISWWLLK